MHTLRNRIAALTTHEVKKVFQTNGVTVSEWAEQHGFSRMLVYCILQGKRKCLRGESHRIAVALGLKKGPEHFAAQAGQSLEMPDKRLLA